MVSTARPACGRPVCHIRGDARVTPYVARGFRRRQVCHTRVQGLAFGGQLSKVSVSNVKSGGIGPYRTYSASTLVPEQPPAPLDSARNEIGQLSSGRGPGGMVGRGRECCPAGLGRQRGRLRREWSGCGGVRRCRSQRRDLRQAGEPAQFLGGRRGCAGPRRQRRAGRRRRGRGEAPGAAQSYVITCQT